jgi:protein-S-isoprenylcysteine O-methyltransferase Ste14
MSTLPAKSGLPPPLPNFLGILLGALAGWLWPWLIAPRGYVLPAGALLTLAGVALCVSMGRAFKRHGTSPDVRHETTAIVTSGPFRYSRNPIYLAFTLVQAGLALIFNNAWILLTTLPAVLVVHHVVVRREEAYLEAKFGAEYRAYKSLVRRWI